MQILMLETRRGSEDGFTTRQFKAGETYDMASSLARTFIRHGWATELEAPTREQLQQILRPVPTNPATLAAKGDL